MDYTEISAEQFAALDGLQDWRFLLGAIQANFRAGSFPAAASLVLAIADAAETALHHPDVDVRYPDRVHVVLTTHATGGLTSLDVDVARSISDLAVRSGAMPEPSAVQGVEIAIWPTPTATKPASVPGKTVDGAIAA